MGAWATLEIGLFVVDVFMVLAGLLMAFWIRFYSGWAEGPLFTDAPTNPTLRGYLPHFTLGVVSFALLLLRGGAYQRDHVLTWRPLLRIFGHTAVRWVVLYLLFSLFFKISPSIARTFVLISGLTVLPCLLAGRFAIRYLIVRTRWLEKIRLRFLVVGWSKQASQLLPSKNVSQSPSPICLEAWLPLGATDVPAALPPPLPRAGSFQDAEPLLLSGRFDGVLLADVQAADREIRILREICDREQLAFLVVPNMFEVLLSGLHLEMLGGVPVLGVNRLPLEKTLNRCLKRLVDVAGALVGLLGFGPLMVAAMVAVRLESPGPVLYRQVRAGRLGQSFRMIKIRTMQIDAEKDSGPQWATEADPRRLRVGAFLRRWNVDEMPQFWHVLKGEMSLVGPRPERPEFIQKFKHELRHYNMRHGGKPGMTGWAQINGLRGNTDLEERIQADLWYLENWSLSLDLYIMIMTLLRWQKNAY